MGLPRHQTQNAIRFSLGRENTAEQIDRLVADLPAIVSRLRSVTAGAAARGVVVS
jgi:cysteine sulfinate desulfinase/cysteine desulfurase-like protein